MTPILLYTFCPFFTAIFLLDTTQTQFLFSLLPPTAHDSMPLKLLAASMEFWLMLFWFAAKQYGGFRNITFVRTVQTSLAESRSRAAHAICDDGATVVASECKLLRRAQLIMNIFNLSTSGMIFANKILDNIGAIAGFYFFVRLISVQPMVSFLFLLFMVDCAGYRTSMWDNAPLIPAMTARLKRQLNVLAEGDSYVKRVLNSVPCLGVQVRGFRSMERDSTVIYLHFVVTNVTAMLITFK